MAVRYTEEQLNTVDKSLAIPASQMLTDVTPINNRFLTPDAA